MKLYCRILRDADGSDCTLGGISSQVDHIYAYYNEADLFEFPKLPEQMDEVALVIKADWILWDKKVLRAFVVKNGKIEKGGMFGGNFIYTSDSRFPTLGDFAQPIQIHDRFEHKGG